MIVYDFAIISNILTPLYHRCCLAGGWQLHLEVESITATNPKFEPGKSNIIRLILILH